MLTALSIHNIVLIEKLDLTFDKGLCVFTGETGAGKSILLDALSLALGARADSSLVRQGCDSATVSALFSLTLGHPAGIVLAGQGIPFDHDIILRRIVYADGRSRAFVNDEPVSITFLKTLGDSLAEIHGQFASHGLLNPASHLGVLDSYGNLKNEVRTCQRAYEIWRYKANQRDEAEQRLAQAIQEETFLRDSVRDLKELAPSIDEEEILSQRRSLLMNSEKIISSLHAAHDIMETDEAGISARLAQTLTLVDRANRLANGQLQNTLDILSEASSLLADVSGSLEKELDHFGDVSELPQIDERLFALRDAARKYHTTVSGLRQKQQEYEMALTHLERGEIEIDTLKKEEEAARLEYVEAAQKLSAARHKAAHKLDTSVRAELPALKLEKAYFETHLEDLPPDKGNANGMNTALFMVSTNAGIAPAPIHKVASGGELARFMLALKANLAKAEQITTLIFDEVDSGVGGETAAAVGERLAALAGEHQVLVVTHSPQVAAYGRHHYTVKKERASGKTRTSVTSLDEEQRLLEIARMLSGKRLTETSKLMAQELLESKCLKK